MVPGRRKFDHILDVREELGLSEESVPEVHLSLIILLIYFYLFSYFKSEVTKIQGEKVGAGGFGRCRWPATSIKIP